MKRKVTTTQRLIEWSVVLMVILVPFCIIILYNGRYGQDRSTTARAKSEQQSIATALEAYFMDNNSYPLPDYDSEGKPIQPHILTTPIAYLTSIFHDPYKNKGKGIYEYGCDKDKDWIITSYGPDRVDGNSKVKNGGPLLEEKAWSDKSLGFSLEGSGLTYDPSNGMRSAGDIWRRGP